ncbi:LysR family transcriptional regulator [Caballeronia glathei]|uniref:LysR family transcriptional regulator n=2 Tax=Caballeronia glathei TaxID=60547 RepID=A0A069PWS0_9BURK|nr:LysR family transcriptional regulator [Caballeronia glathei]
MIHNMRAFVRVVEAGTFTAVAKESDLTTAQVSRAVSMLENELQAVLIRRSTRHLSVTDAGAKYYERAKSILADLDNAKAEARNVTAHAEGHLRVHSSPGLAQSLVTDALVAYQAAHPDVSVELVIEHSMPNLVEGGFDISLLGASQLPDSGYITQTLGSNHAVLAASPAYLKQHGIPKDPADLAAHSLLRLESPVSPSDEWHLESATGAFVVPVTAYPFQTNSPDAMRHALRAGAGIGMLAAYSAIDDLRNGTLVRVLPELRLRPFNVYAVYVSRRYLDAKTRTLIEHLRATISPALARVQRDVELLTGPSAARIAKGRSGKAVDVQHLVPDGVSTVFAAAH